MVTARARALLALGSGCGRATATGRLAYLVCAVRRPWPGAG
jgi:hypothetical protein